MRYDIAVIGNDEAAFELLCAAGNAGKRVLAVLPEQRHSEWIVSIALRRLIEQLLSDGMKRRFSVPARRGTPSLVKRLLANTLASEILDYVNVFERLGIDVLVGEAKLSNRENLVVTRGANCSRSAVSAENIVVGCGTRRTSKYRPLGLLPTSRPEALLSGPAFPHSMTILGGEQLGGGFAALLSLFGVQTRWVCHHDPDCAMSELVISSGVEVAENADVENEVWSQSRSLFSDDVIDFRRSVGFTEHLGLAEVGIEPDEFGRLWCASSLETWCSGVFGIGDVVGFSADVSRNPTEQARRILNRVNHRIRRPHFLRSRTMSFASSSTGYSN